jgi:tetratricopeptide (TPR) repeat protein
MSESTSNDEHRQAIDRAAQEAAGGREEALSGEIDEAVALVGELLARPGAERQELIQEARFHGIKICQLLLERSEELWCDDAGSAVEVARLAVEISGRLDARWYGKGLVEDMQAMAWAVLGNSCRVASDLRSAEEALDRADAHLERSGGEAYTEAEILSFRASLRSSQCRFCEAVKLLDRALAIYRSAKDRHFEARL